MIEYKPKQFISLSTIVEDNGCVDKSALAKKRKKYWVQMGGCDLVRDGCRFLGSEGNFGVSCRLKRRKKLICNGRQEHIDPTKIAKGDSGGEMTDSLYK